MGVQISTLGIVNIVCTNHAPNRRRLNPKAGCKLSNTTETFLYLPANRGGMICDLSTKKPKFMPWDKFSSFCSIYAPPTFGMTVSVTRTSQRNIYSTQQVSLRYFIKELQTAIVNTAEICSLRWLAGVGRIAWPHNVHSHRSSCCWQCWSIVYWLLYVYCMQSSTQQSTT